jgi:hypothetical protein
MEMLSANQEDVFFCRVYRKTLASEAFVVVVVVWLLLVGAPNPKRRASL